MESIAHGVVYSRKLAGNNMCFPYTYLLRVHNDNNMVKFCFVIFVTFSTFIFTIFLFERKTICSCRIRYPLNGLNIFPNPM